MKIPFAPHSPDWVKFDDGKTCYAVLDGRRIDSNSDDLDAALQESASELLGKPVELNNAFWAGDFICGEVLIVYYRVKEEV